MLSINPTRLSHKTKDLYVLCMKFCDVEKLTDILPGYIHLIDLYVTCHLH